MRRAEKNDTNRRLGPVGSEVWEAMLDAAEDALLVGGVANLSAARVSERLGIKRRLVYYYFQTLDDLIVETFRRKSVRTIQKIREAVESDMPLRDLWAECVRSNMHPRLISEYMALAHRIDGLREEVTYFILETRRLQIKAISSVLSRRPGLSDLDPATVAVIATSTALTLVREAELGVTEGHEDIEQLIEGFLAAAETGDAGPQAATNPSATAETRLASNPRKNSAA